MFALTPAGSAADAADGARKIGRFKVLGLVGRGGFGEVYAAHDPELDRRVALKVLAHTENRAAVASLHREALTMARLSHPNVARVFDVGDVDGHLFIAMEFVRGDTLRAWLRREQRSWSAIREVFLAAGQGLAAAHREGIVHRDFKPDNVIIDEDGRPRVIDFGLAAATAEDTASPAQTADEDELNEVTQPSDPGRGGTPAYMAPEQHLGRQADARSDQYSFCVALYEALHGRRPFVGRTWQTLSPQVLRVDAVTASRKVPPHLRRAVQRGLSPAPERRFPDMDALLAELVRDNDARKLGRWLALGTGACALVGAAVWLSMPAAAERADDPDNPVGTAAPAACVGAHCANTTAESDPRVEALTGQLELARALRRSGRSLEALQVLRALADAARSALGPDHALSRVAEEERAALASVLAGPSAARP
jgi:predicted Ser/Thr protein kinase